MNQIKVQLDLIKKRIEAACTRSGRDPDRVRLVAVAKTKPAAMVEEAFAAGQEIIGESYVQELVAKAGQVRVPVQWHFLGHLQSNKVKYLPGIVRMIHSVDRLSLAREISRQWEGRGEPVDILIQADLAGEETKFGVSEEDLESFIRPAAELPNLRIRGLMTLPPYLPDPEKVRPYFTRLRELAGKIDGLKLPGVEMRELSMGMSHDFEVAVEEGATLVRVGTAIFGERG